jgi:hypothetical protein
VTIFLDIAKHFLVVELRNEKRRASMANESWTGILRDAQFSKQKIEEMKELRNKLLALSDEKDDHATCQEISNLIKPFRTTVAQQCKDKGLGEGQLGLVLRHMIDLVETIYSVLEKKNLLNVQPSPMPNVKFDYYSPTSLRYKDSLDRFYYYAALYFCTKGVEEKNLLTRFVDKFLWSSIAVTKEKETALEGSLEKCKLALNALDTEKPGYLLSKVDRVLECISDVIRQNVEICSNHATLKEGIPLAITPLSLFSLQPTLRPTRGTLREFMEKAYSEVGALKADYEKKLKEVYDNEPAKDSQAGNLSRVNGKNGASPSNETSETITNKVPLENRTSVLVNQSFLNNKEQQLRLNEVSAVNSSTLSVNGI